MKEHTNQTEIKGRRSFFLPSYCQSAEISTIQQEGERRNKKVGKKTEGNVLNIRQHHCRQREASISTQKCAYLHMLHLRLKSHIETQNKRSLLLFVVSLLLVHVSMSWISWLSSTASQKHRPVEK